MATHSIILASRIPWSEEPGELQSMESQSQTQLSMNTPTPMRQSSDKKAEMSTYMQDKCLMSR